jgi:hypothetical protein
MENLRTFESFLNESAMSDMDTFDPNKAKKKAPGDDKDKSGLSFPLIKEVFGNDSYALRFIIAQALYLANWDLFQTNSSFPDGTDLRVQTMYIGDADQNAMLKKVTKKQLEAIKPLVRYIMNTPDDRPDSPVTPYKLTGMVAKDLVEVKRILNFYANHNEVRGVIKPLFYATKDDTGSGPEPKTYPFFV